jgi:hypothetical protein
MKHSFRTKVAALSTAFIMSASLLAQGASAQVTTSNKVKVPTDAFSDKTIMALELNVVQPGKFQDWIVPFLSDALAQKITEMPIECCPDEKDSDNNPALKEERVKAKKAMTDVLAQILKGNTLNFALEPSIYEKMAMPKPNISITANVTDEQWAIITKNISPAKAKKTYKNAEYYSNETQYPEITIGRSGNIGIMTETEDELKKIVDQLESSTNLTSNPHYGKVMQRFNMGKIGSMFINNASLVQFMEQVNENNTNKDDELSNTINALKKIIESGKGTGISLNKKQDGIEIQAIDYFDPAKRKAAGLENDGRLYMPTLAAKSPVAKPMIFMETSNLKKAWEQELNWLTKINMQADQEVLREGAQEFEKTTGIDMEKDIVDLMEKEVMFVVGDQETSFFPSVSLMADVQGKKEGAQNTINKMVQFLERNMKKEIAEGKFQMESIGPAGTTQYRFIIKVDQEKAARDPLAKAAQALTLEVGITSDEVLYITTDSDFTKHYRTGIQEAAIKAAERPALESRLYFGVKNIAAYAKKVMKMGYDATSEEDKKYFDINKATMAIDKIIEPWNDLITYSYNEGDINQGFLTAHFDLEALTPEYFKKVQEWSKDLDQNQERYSAVSAEDFNDTKPNEWYYKDVREARVYGTAKGYSEDQTFRPGNSVTRAEFLTMAMRTAYGENDNYAYGDIVTPNGKKINDVTSYDWYFNSIKQAVEKGIVSGYSDNSFKPNAPITRAEAAVIIKKIMEEKGVKIMEESDLPDLPSAEFDDVPQEAWFKEAVDVNYAGGIIKGDAENNGVRRFSPSRNLNRAEAAAMMNRLRPHVMMEEQAGE